MVNKLIEEINLALDNNLYLVVLNTALTLPDICGKAEYPELKTAERYKKWYQENIGQHEQRPDDKENNIDFPYLSDNVVYQLRCSLLHQGNPNIEKGKTGIDEFTLAIEEKNQFELYADSASLETYCNECKKTYTVNVRRLCFILCQTAKIYYENNKEKFSFFNYSILDLDNFHADIQKRLREDEQEEKEMQELTNQLRKKFGIK